MTEQMLPDLFFVLQSQNSALRNGISLAIKENAHVHLTKNFLAFCETQLYF